MALPRVEVEITADTQRAEAGFGRVEAGMAGVGNAADRASARTDNLGRSLNRTTPRTSSFGRGIQNASFQLGDFATQVGAGTNASIALGQQLPQLLGGFGILGAVLGAVVAVAVPLTRVFGEMKTEGEGLGQVLGVLEPLAGSLASAFATVRDIGIQMAEVIVNNLDRILITAGTVAAFFAAKWVAAFVAAQVATFSLAGALTFLRGALIRTGFGAIIIGAGELVYQFTRLVQAAGSFGEAMALLKAVGVEVWERLKIGASAMVDYMQGLWLRMQSSFISAISGMAKAASDMLWSLGQGLANIPGMEDFAANLMGVSNDILGGSVGAGGLDEMASGLAANADAMFGSAAGKLGAASAPLESIQKIKDLLASIKDERITLPDLLGVGGGDEEGEGGSGGGGEGSASKKLDEELTAQEERVREHFDRIKALTMGGLSAKANAWGDYFSNLITLTGTNNQKLLQLQKSFAAASALINAWEAYNQVLADPSLPWYAKAAAAAQVLAAGIGAVNAIKGVSAGGATSGASGSAGGGSANSASSGNQSSAASQSVALTLTGGDLFSRDQVVDLINKINEAQEDGAIIRVTS